MTNFEIRGEAYKFTLLAWKTYRTRYEQAASHERVKIVSAAARAFSVPEDLMRALLEHPESKTTITGNKITFYDVLGYGKH